jgi:hypothetical protein
MLLVDLLPIYRTPWPDAMDRMEVSVLREARAPLPLGIPAGTERLRSAKGLREMARQHALSIWKRYGFLWVTLVLFAGSLLGHWSFAWFSFVNEQEAHGLPVEFREYAVQTARDTLENWQSEFLQLIWQVAGLAYLLHVGSPQSKEGDERKEEKIDRILAAVDKDGEKHIRELDAKYPRKN